MKYPKSIVKIEDNLKENYKQNVDEKERIAYNKRPKQETIKSSNQDSSKVSTTVSGDGESPLDNIKEENKDE